MICRVFEIPMAPTTTVMAATRMKPVIRRVPMLKFENMVGFL